jgi:hypothetical protein
MTKFKLTVEFEADDDLSPEEARDYVRHWVASGKGSYTGEIYDARTSICNVVVSLPRRR